MRKFPATIRTASNKKKRDSVIPSTCEGTEYGVYEGDVLFAFVHGDKFLIFCMTYSLTSSTKCDLWPGRELSRSRKN